MMQDQFAAQGFCAVKLFDPDMVRAAQDDIVELVDRVAGALYMPADRSLPGAPLADRLDRIAAVEQSYANLLRVAICTDAHRGPRLAALAGSPPLIETAARLAGRPIDGSVMRVRASIAAFPEHRHDWHSDVAIDDGTSCGRVRVTAWIPLSDAGPDNGGLEVVPGKRAAPFEHRRDGGFAIPADTLAGLPRIQPNCPAGTVLFLDRFTPHRTLPVLNAARFALVIWFKAG